MKRLHTGLFENGQPNDTGTVYWRHPDNERHNYDSLRYWTDLARLCEDAKLDFLFLADAWGWAEIDGKRPEPCSIEGLELPRIDPAIIVASLIPGTQHLGLTITAATLVEQPFSLERRLASLDQLSGGRFGWNVGNGGHGGGRLRARCREAR